MKYNENILTAARLAWNDLSELLDVNPNIHLTNETFEDFYALLIQKLTEKQADD